jgi:hypothetical protein
MVTLSPGIWWPARMRCAMTSTRWLRGSTAASLRWTMGTETNSDVKSILACLGDFDRMHESDAAQNRNQDNATTIHKERK